MDGYVRFNTDDKGQAIDIWEEWYKNSEVEFYIGECGLGCYLQEQRFNPNSLILITFKHKSEVTESYMYGKEYDDYIEVVNEIVLIENYNCEDIEEMEELDFIEELLKRGTPKKPIMIYNHERGEDRECCPSCEMIRVYKNENYCTECGQKLDWEE